MKTNGSSSKPNSFTIDDREVDIRAGENVFALVGSGLGGTSLINANVAMRPDLAIFRRAPWPRAFGT